jgi:hypothetical protein
VPQSDPMLREARLRSEFADRYPGIEPGVWFTAATLAEHLLTRFVREGKAGEEISPRVLDSTHFEFRGRGGDMGARMTLGGGSD